MAEQVLCPLCDSLVVFSKGEVCATCPYCRGRLTLDRLMGHVYAEPELC
jgi:uncharacterized CHY-type Zn-finger protein